MTGSINSVLLQAGISALLCTGSSAAQVRGSFHVATNNEAADGMRSIDLNNYNNVQYSGPFSMGGQSIPVIYDTGSFEVIALSTECHECPKQLTMYDEGASKTFRKGKVEGTHRYVSGVIHTQEGYDNLALGADKTNPFVAKDMTMWMVKNHTMSFWANGHAIFSGIVGLSHVEKLLINYSGDNNDLRSMLQQMNLKSFAMCFQRGEGTPTGKLYWGMDAQAYVASHASAFTTVPIEGAHWSTKLSGLDIDGYDTSSHCKPSCLAMVDSGTSMLGIPKSLQPVMNKLENKIKSDCSNINTLPEIGFNLGTAEITLPPKAWVFRGTSGGKPYCKAAFMYIDKKSSQFGETFILGMPFFRYHFTIFDKEKNQFHIARSNKDCSVASGSSLALKKPTLAAQADSQKTNIAAFKSGKRHQHLSGFLDDDYTTGTEGDLTYAISGRWAWSAQDGGDIDA
eukprot:TRINITY_DN1672_c0_g1_i1.p1 TRINITY_DN1672_c0_g1~~TRINITY_DN1672_c0_g1_i1.p1  ORF type:complete len:454 (-),score=86.63 TRINITY_DN1672_c0_g1_i1:154-1515(-)